MTQPSEPLLLNHDEALLMSCGSFHATDKRVIRVGRRSGSEILESIAYRELDSVENLSVPRIQTIGLSLLVILLTVLVDPDGLIRTGCFLLGVVGVAVGFLYPRNYYQFQSSGWGKRARRRWRLARNRYTYEQSFINVLRAEHAKWTLNPISDSVDDAKHNTKLFSIVVVPADNPSAVTRAFEDEADMLCVDLVGTLVPVDSDVGRELVWSEIVAASRSNSLPIVRVSSGSLECDLKACVWPGLWGVLIAVESPMQIRELDGLLASLEETRNIPRTVEVVVLLETEAVLDLIPEIVGASSRVSMIVLGNTDLLAEVSTGFQAEASEGDNEALSRKKEHWRGLTTDISTGGAVPLALIGTTVRSEELETILETRGGMAVEQVLEIARGVGFHGFVTAHRQVVETGKYSGNPDKRLIVLNGVSE